MCAVGRLQVTVDHRAEGRKLGVEFVTQRPRQVGHLCKRSGPADNDPAPQLACAHSWLTVSRQPAQQFGLRQVQEPAAAEDAIHDGQRLHRVYCTEGAAIF